MHGGWDGLGWFWMAVMMVIVWLPLLLGGLWVLAQLGRAAGPSAAPPRAAENADARELARRAYARGDFDRERFLRVMEDLDRAKPPSRGA